MNNESGSDGLTEPIAQQFSPRLTLRVGITGHRLNKLQSANEDLLRMEIKRVLESLKTTADELHSKASARPDMLYLSAPPLLRIISPLAEGADRLLAEVANTLGEESDLQCPLPFSQAEYEKDFETPESLAQFRELLAKATSVLELDGSRENPDCRDRSYEAVGRTVLDHSDVMIAIWDGEPGERGGTGQIVSNAEYLNIPVIWIDSTAPHNIRVKVNRGDEWTTWASAAGSLSEKLAILFLPPPDEALHESEKRRPDLLTAYFQEKEPKLRFGLLWRWFRSLVAENVPATNSNAATDLPPEVADQLYRAIGKYYLRADRLADYYANMYRSAFVFNFLMSAFAVLFAFVGLAYAHPESEGAWRVTVAEVIIISAIILVTVLGIKNHWHERWIDYRFLAEHLRQTPFLMALGRSSVSVQRFPTSVLYGDPRNSWMYWYLQAIVRDSGIVHVRFDRNYLKTVKNFLIENINGQVDYHVRTAKIIDSLNRRLHLMGISLFFLALVAAMLHIPFHWTLLSIFTIVGPSFGAALAAIRSQGEFERLTKSSYAMSSQLESVSQKVADLPLGNSDLSSVKLGELAIESAQLMVKDVLNWRLMVEEKPLDLPA